MNHTSIAVGGWVRRSNPSGNCVEVRLRQGVSQLRDSALGDRSPVLAGGLGALRGAIRANG